MKFGMELILEEGNRLLFTTINKVYAGGIAAKRQKIQYQKIKKFNDIHIYIYH